MVYACQVNPITSEAIQRYAFSKGLTWSGYEKKQNVSNLDFKIITLGFFEFNKLTVIYGIDNINDPHALLSLEDFLSKIDEVSKAKTFNIHIDNRKYVVTKDGITVGCTKIPPQNVEELITAWKEVNNTK